MKVYKFAWKLIKKYGLFTDLSNVDTTMDLIGLIPIVIDPLTYRTKEQNIELLKKLGVLLDQKTEVLNDMVRRSALDPNTR